MKSEIQIISVEIKDGFEKVIADHAVLQAAKDEPKKLVSMTAVGDYMILAFELV